VKLGLPGGLQRSKKNFSSCHPHFLWLHLTTKA